MTYFMIFYEDHFMSWYVVAGTLGHFFLVGGGVTKTLRNTYGGSCQMLTFDDKGGGRGVGNPQNTLT